MADVVAEMGGDDPEDGRRWQLALTALVEAILADSIEASALEFPTEHPFWGLVTRTQGREVAGALASLGYRSRRAWWLGGRSDPDPARPLPRTRLRGPGPDAPAPVPERRRDGRPVARGDRGRRRTPGGSGRRPDPRRTGHDARQARGPADRAVESMGPTPALLLDES
ncbi:MAG: hypothetical protein WKF78_10935 [Candidatus Limnocylindrales bacterium]